MKGDHGHKDVQASTTSALHAKGKRKNRAPMVETKVRRSTRLLCTAKGYKQDTCQNSNCMACTIGPPPIKSKIVKNLNMTYCKVKAKDTAEELLEKKKQKKGGKDKGAAAPKKA